MAYRVLCSLNNLLIKDSKTEYSYKELELSTDWDLLRSLFYSDNFIKKVGTNELILLEINPFLYFEKLTPEVRSLTFIPDILNSVTNDIVDLVESLWFIKDSCVSIFKSYFEDIRGGQILSTMRIPMVCNSIGRFETVSFSIDEFKEAEHILNSYLKISSRVIPEINFIKKEKEGLNNLSYNFQIYNSNNRIDKALNFLIIARQSLFLPQKISNYIPIYECLFTPGENTEVSHKLCERVALYIGTDKEEKIEIYNFFRKVYNLRSQFFHGNSLGKEFNLLENQQDISIRLDNITRQVLKKIILEDTEQFLKADDELKNYFTSLVFN